MIKNLFVLRLFDKFYPHQDLLVPSKNKVVSFSQVEVVTLKITFAVVLFFSVFDLWHDFNTNSAAGHFVVDIFLAVLIMLGLGILIYRTQKIDKNIVKLQTAYFGAQKDAQESANEKSLILKGFGEFIEVQLEKWKLSHAEKEIALLLLKGLSHNEIAEIRHTSERTVRQQSLNIYSKSGVKGRSDLAAFFLEDILNASLPSENNPKA